MFLDFAKDQLRPSSPLLLVAFLTVGAVWLWRRRGAAAPRAFIALLAAGYWFISTPFGSNLLVRAVASPFYRIETREQASGADTVVLLGGGVSTATVAGETAGVPTGSTLLRALEAARVFRTIEARLMVASGGRPRPDRQALPESAVLRRLLVDAGVPSGSIVEESGSTNTLTQATEVAAMLRPRGIRRIVLVTSPTHMPRARAMFQGVGFDAIASMAPMRSEGAPRALLLLPNDESMDMSDEAVYECAALTYYRLRGVMRR